MIRRSRAKNPPHDRMKFNQPRRTLRAGDSEHTLSIPGGMVKWRICADFCSTALCQAPMGHFGSASGTVRETEHFRAAGSKRTVRTVRHCRLAPMGKPMDGQPEGAAWPGSR